jgi:hypothetical protein
MLLVTREQVFRASDRSAARRSMEIGGFGQSDPARPAGCGILLRGSESLPMVREA